MRRLVRVVTVLFWASVALMTVLVGLSWVAPGLRDEQTFLSLSGVSVGLRRFVLRCCSGKSSAPTANSSAPFGGRAGTSAWKRRATSGPLKRGSTPPPWVSPSLSHGTCCPPCSCPEQAACRILHSVATPRSYDSRVSYT